MQRPADTLTRFAWLSIGAALLTIGLKVGAYLVTGSVSLLSDALESLVNLAAAVVALAALTFAARPPDEDHSYGHHKVEYFSSGVEGALILVAAGSIIVAAWERLSHPQPVNNLGLGLAASTGASLINLAVAQILLRAGRHYRSVTLEADAHHLMTDVWTSGGVLVGLGAVAITGWAQLDPLIALIVAVNIILSGVRILRQSFLGLIDTALSREERQAVIVVLEGFREQGIDYHALRTRQAGTRRFISVHILVPGFWSVQRGHQVLEEIEGAIRRSLAGSTVFTHLEPLEDPASWRDQGLDRVEEPEGVTEK